MVYKLCELKASFVLFYGFDQIPKIEKSFTPLHYQWLVTSSFATVLRQAEIFALERTFGVFKRQPLNITFCKKPETS